MGKADIHPSVCDVFLPEHSVDGLQVIYTYIPQDGMIQRLLITRSVFEPESL